MGKLIKPKDSKDVILLLSINEMLDLPAKINGKAVPIGNLVGSAALDKAIALGADNNPAHFKISLEKDKVKIILEPLPD